MKAQDLSAVIVMCLVGSVCLYFAIEAAIVGEVICLSRDCARHISLTREPKMFYLNVGGLLFAATILIGWSIRIVFRRRNKDLP